MRCNHILALLLTALVLGPNAVAQIPSAPADQQLKPPGAASAVPTSTPPLTLPGAAPASSGAVPAGSSEVLTLSQAANSVQATVSAAASTQPPIVPKIESNKLLDAAGPKASDGEDKQKSKPIEFMLLRITHVDDEPPRALMKIYGVSRYVEIGSQVQKRIVTNISDEGVCLEDPKAAGSNKKSKATSSKKSYCPHLVQFQ